MKCEIVNGELVLRVPISKNPEPSKTGKTLIVASSHGPQKTGCKVNGKEVTVGFNAYIK